MLIQVAMRAKKQIAIQFPPGWGGKRKGAGRPRILPGKPRGAHVKRARIPERIPVHVTVRISPKVESMRVHSALRVVARAIWQAQGKFGMRITHFTLESNHLHLIVEGLCAA